ncbi:MAG TPA: hypothetical protein DCQ64_20095 [Candidatus Rokubacteria bacterium]|nr:hypothetical protein [Candidatus Rokubacteria bacterium]
MQWLWRLSGRIPCLRREVIVNLSDGATAIRGVLIDVAGPWFVLKQASVLQVGSKPVAMDGDAVIDRAKVLFIQVV